MKNRLLTFRLVNQMPLKFKSCWPVSITNRIPEYLQLFTSKPT